MSPISFFAQGLPKGQPRPRAFARKMGDKFVARVYDAGTAEGWKSCIAEAAKPHVEFYVPAIKEPICVVCTFVLPRPKAHFRTGKRSHELREDAPRWNTSSPDLDNYEKAVWDTLVRIGLLADDSYIVRNGSSKVYANLDERSGALVTISDA